MTFTDDDLKTLKSALQLNAMASLVPANGLALLARLEVAELLIEHFKPYVPVQSLDDCLTYQLWLKTAGK